MTKLYTLGEMGINVGVLIGDKAVKKSTWVFGKTGTGSDDRNCGGHVDGESVVIPDKEPVGAGLV